MKDFKTGIIAVDFKGTHVDIEFLLSTTGIMNVYPIIAVAVANKLHPIISVKETLDQASIIRMSIPNDAIETELLYQLTTK